MLRGWFAEGWGAPFLKGRLTIPRLGVSADVSWLVDTGADSSLLNPPDASEIGLDYSRLRNRIESLGTAGIAYSYAEPASIAFTDPGKSVYVYHLTLDIAEPSPETMELPSLLGREVLDRMRMVYDPSRGVLTFTVRSADLVIPIRKR